MKHKRVPRWAEDAAAGPIRPMGPGRLSDLIGRLEVRCDLCNRRGVYRADRLIARYGDLPVADVLVAIARDAQCVRALNPPASNDMHYAVLTCRIRRAR